MNADGSKGHCAVQVKGNKKVKPESLPEGAVILYSTQGDLLLDRSIQNKICSGERLTVAETKRAKRKAAVVRHSGGICDPLFKAVCKDFSSLISSDGKRLCRNMKL
eukprot:TRINITY_DN3439_c0_g1_i1.p2 TRINITY_DN3439_c0_g1~~TRINITY_DN3439_c0_g1_i1.p2  ORF type:complete len:106 (-),score=12.90 TRINITY_DN3439_c0_g1_i1:183-500(-)